MIVRVKVRWRWSIPEVLLSEWARKEINPQCFSFTALHSSLHHSSFLQGSHYSRLIGHEDYLRMRWAEDGAKPEVWEEVGERREIKDKWRKTEGCRMRKKSRGDNWWESMCAEWIVLKYNRRAYRLRYQIVITPADGWERLPADLCFVTACLCE